MPGLGKMEQVLDDIVFLAAMALKTIAGCFAAQVN
jgi:hypothetical protein